MVNPALLLRRVPLAPVVGVMFGATAAALVAATPHWMLESAVSSTGLSAAFALARPPLGMTALLLMMLVAFVVVAASMAAVVALIERVIGGLAVRRQRDVNLAAFAEELPKEGGRRRPISADRELGAPLMSDEALATAQDTPQVEPEPVALEQPAEPQHEQVEPYPVATTAPDEHVPDVVASETPKEALPESSPEIEDSVEEAPLVLEAPEPVDAMPGQAETPIIEDLMVDDELLLDTPLTPDALPEAMTTPVEPQPVEPQLVESEPVAPEAIDTQPVEPTAAEAGEQNLDAPLEVAEFDLPAPPEDFAVVEGESSIEALIRRLEAGLARRGHPGAPDPSTPSAAAVSNANPATRPHDWMVPDARANDDAEQALGTLRTMAGR